MDDREALKERILYQAQEALRQEGYFGVSLRQVARGAGIHPSVVSQLFGNRKGLLAALNADRP